MLTSPAEPAPGVPIRGTTRLAGVLGHPVAHSRSPAMHNAAFAALGLDWAYVPLAVAPARLVEALAGLVALGFRGANVTIPHKEAAAAACDELSPEARRAGSANTVLVEEDGRLRGETTDGEGMLGALGAPVAGREALVLGAGGAARAAVAALIGAGAAPVRVAGRRAEPTRALADALGAEPAPWPPDEGAGLVVNATPVGQAGDPEELPLDPELLPAGAVVCDLAYRGDGAPTALVRAAQARGLRAVDGLEVLVQQGALAFTLFTGRAAPLDVMRAAARAPAARAETARDR